MKYAHSLALLILLVVCSCNERTTTSVTEQKEASPLYSQEMKTMLTKLKTAAKNYQQKSDEIKASNDSLYKAVGSAYQNFIDKSTFLIKKQNELLQKQLILEEKLLENTKPTEELKADRKIINKDFELLKEAYKQLQQSFEDLEYNLNSPHAEEYSVEET
ncbi:hypothetical protein [Aquimarina brevivitae]|uniref:Uncharacterized protein n=1 Tax=Aquimarina brevivitae TaxID=323412 RepID=A0A4Q7PIA8_9FLAO|nr:hypothetical protein [Aquimarina brevivitae]RZT00307.1 hypothetical protein EV197_1543 [Aquimarina brevivitae]